MYQHHDLLGQVHTSKLLSVAQFGDTREEPTVTRLELHAWALWRMTCPPDFLGKRPDCRDAWQKEVRALSAEIAVSHRALNARAEECLREWLPSFFVA